MSQASMTSPERLSKEMRRIKHSWEIAKQEPPEISHRNELQTSCQRPKSPFQHFLDMSLPVPSGLIQGVSMGTERWQLEGAGFEGGLNTVVSGFRCFSRWFYFLSFPHGLMLCYFLCAEKRKNTNWGGLIISLVTISPCDATLCFIPGFTTTSWVKCRKERATYSDVNCTPHFPLLYVERL